MTQQIHNHNNSNNHSPDSCGICRVIAQERARKLAGMQRIIQGETTVKDLFPDPSAHVGPVLPRYKNRLSLNKK